MSYVALAPDVLYPRGWDAKERDYVSLVVRRAFHVNGYERVVIPLAGNHSLALSLAQGEGKIPPARILASDTSLYSAVLGYLHRDGTGLEMLEVCLDGAPVDLESSDPIRQAAVLLWTQLHARLEHKARAAVYWEEIAFDVLLNRQRHLDTIERRVREQHALLEGMRFLVESPQPEIEGYLADPRALIVVACPSSETASAKFEDTGGRLTWVLTGTELEPWHPRETSRALAADGETSPALLIAQQSAAPRTYAERSVPVYARHTGPGQYVYVWANRPEEVFAFTGGPVVQPRSPADIAPLDRPMLPDDHVFGDEAEVSVIPVGQAAAAWYKQRWLHRLAGAEGAYNFAVLVDGYVAGIGGYSFKAIQTPFPGVEKKDWAGGTIVRFACGPAHEYRTTRLATLLAIQRETLLTVAHSMPSVMLMAAGSDKFVTTVFTRHPESKGLRGLMRLADRRKDALDGYRLVYWASMGEMSAKEAYASWLGDERRYLEKRRERAQA